MREGRLRTLRSWIKPGNRVLDLGCGDGTVLADLRESLGVQAYGVDIEPNNIIACLQRGVNAIQADLDNGLDLFADNAFDVVILAQTLQEVEAPAALLKEMLRVGKEGIISIPNFGHIEARFQLLFKGKMPTTRALPDHWYESDSIRLCTLRDFELLCSTSGARILEKVAFDERQQGTVLTRACPNLFAASAYYRVCAN